MNNSFLNSPYFNAQKKQVQEAVVVEKQQVDGPVDAPNMEIKKGFTSIVIPAYFMNYSLFHQTGHCIGAVREHTDNLKTPYEIILVINGKTGIGFDNLEATHADKVVVNEENRGYGGAMNQGIRMSTGEYIVLLSNDVLVFNNWLEDFHEALEHKDLVMATPMYGMPYARAVESAQIRERLMSKPIEESFSDFRDFSCVAAKRQLFNEIGVFDEKIFVYKEDLDMMNRMDEAHKTYASSKRINTYHIIGATSVNMSEQEQRKEEGTAYFNQKWNKV